MEQVICINNKFIDGYNLANIALELLKEGEIYTVESFEMTLNGIGKYFLKEVSNGDLGWSALRFVPLSSIDETEMVREIEIQVTKT